MSYDAKHDIFVESGTAKLGQWCGSCAAPSAVRVPLVAISRLGAHVRSAVYLCTRCDSMVTVRVI